MKKYILFDNDGVLVDTEPLYYKASRRALKEFFNLEISFGQYMGIMTKGLGVWELIPDTSITEQEITIARDKRNEYYQELITSNEIVIPHVKEVLQELSKKYKMAIVTSARRVDFELKHKNSGITEMMEFVLCEGEYPRSKPHPDPYLKALHLLDAKANEALVIEDSKRGLDAAYSAKIECYTVFNEFTKNQDLSKATKQLSNIKELLTLL
jgi:HAD superfamily hydrolase (TIGR01509 family)